MIPSTPIISPEEAQKVMSDPDVTIVDARGGADAYDRYTAAHLSGAVFASLEADLSEIGPDAAVGGRHPLPHPGKFGATLGRLGIHPASRILVYDDQSGANAAARFWWMMRAAGHDHVQVIDGGLTAIRDVMLPLDSGAPPTPKERPPYPVDTWRLPLADIHQVETLAGDDSAVVIDVRESYRYKGEREPIDLIAGHIPGAINLPYIDNLRPDGRFRSREEMMQRYKDFKDKDSHRIAVHCGSGVTACHTLLAFEIAGLPIPRLYVGSWSEWSRNNKPVAKAIQD